MKLSHCVDGKSECGGQNGKEKRQISSYKKKVNKKIEMKKRSQHLQKGYVC